MSLYIASLNSGSNGNCYYVGNEEEAVLVDVGMSCKEIEKRMLRCGLQMKKVKAIFISHEHIDHIRGVEVISKKHNLPVYINERTYENGRIKLKDELINSFLDGEILPVGALNVIPFLKSHDAADPYSFSVEHNGVRVGIFTDIGTVCEKLIAHFKECHAAFLETNYDEEMLEKGMYPHYLKARIRGDKGHLSNAQALELFKNHKPDFLSLVLLSHLSKDNNSPELARELFLQHAGETEIVVASRYNESEVYCIRNETDGKLRFSPIEKEQLSLF